jgi:hypothetical protein
MNSNKLMEQVLAIFSIFMVFFYLGVGFYIAFIFPKTAYTYVGKPVLVILGSTFMFYGLYRAYRTYVKIVELFFTKNDEK